MILVTWNFVRKLHFIVLHNITTGRLPPLPPLTAYLVANSLRQPNKITFIFYVYIQFNSYLFQCQNNASNIIRSRYFITNEGWICTIVLVHLCSVKENERDSIYLTVIRTNDCRIIVSSFVLLQRVWICYRQLFRTCDRLFWVDKRE